MHKFLFYDKFIICLYMFRAQCAHHQEVKVVLYSIWYHHTCRWPSGAQVERGLVRKYYYRRILVRRNQHIFYQQTSFCLLQNIT